MKEFYFLYLLIYSFHFDEEFLLGGNGSRVGVGVGVGVRVRPHGVVYRLQG